MAVRCGTMPVPKQDEDWDEATDVVVVGSGFSGLAAAIEARRGGAEVVILEKLRTPGGNSSISDGGIAAPGVATLPAVTRNAPAAPQDPDAALAAHYAAQAIVPRLTGAQLRAQEQEDLASIGVEA